MEIVIYTYQGITMLDAIGPYEILHNIKGVDIKFVAKSIGNIKADSGFLNLNIKHSINEIEKADILLIPGSSIAFIREMKDNTVLEWIRKIDKTSKKTVSVCSGSIILGATGLLKGKKATSHWKVIPLLKDFGITPTRERIVEEGKYITAAGVSAGIDMAIYLSNQLKGEMEAKAAQLVIEYDPNPMFDSGNYKTAEKDIIELAEKKMTFTAKKEMKLLEMLMNYGTLKKLRG